MSRTNYFAKYNKCYSKFRWVSHELKAIWYETPKVACATMKLNGFKLRSGSGVKQEFDPKGENPFKFIPLDRTYDSTRHRHFVPNQYADYFKFGFVRNPWDRMVSNWAMCNEQPVKCSGFCHKSFATFVDGIKRGRSNAHWEKQIHYVPADTIKMDFVGRFENLGEDWLELCRKLGIPEEPLPLYNTSKHKHYTEYYNDDLIKIVRKMYVEDVKNFGYRFGV